MQHTVIELNRNTPRPRVKWVDPDGISHCELLHDTTEHRVVSLVTSPSQVRVKVAIAPIPILGGKKLTHHTGKELSGGEFREYTSELGPVILCHRMLHRIFRYIPDNIYYKPI